MTTNMNYQKLRMINRFKKWLRR